jgi:hypothetical protein
LRKYLEHCTKIIEQEDTKGGRNEVEVEVETGNLKAQER